MQDQYPIMPLCAKVNMRVNRMCWVCVLPGKSVTLRSVLSQRLLLLWVINTFISVVPVILIRTGVSAMLYSTKLCRTISCARLSQIQLAAFNPLAPPGQVAAGGVLQFDSTGESG